MHSALVDTRDMHWSFSGRCRETPDVWSSDNWGVRAQAAHICRVHCPVLKECTRELASIPDRLLHGVVMAGISHTPDGGKPTWISTEGVVCVPCGLTRPASQKAEVSNKSRPNSAMVRHGR